MRLPSRLALLSSLGLVLIALGVSTGALGGPAGPRQLGEPGGTPNTLIPGGGEHGGFDTDCAPTSVSAEGLLEDCEGFSSIELPEGEPPSDSGATHPVAPSVTAGPVGALASPAASPRSEPPALAGRAFLSMSIRPADGRDAPPPGTAFTLLFSDTDISAWGLCGAPRGSYRLQDGRLVVSALGRPDIDCDASGSKRDAWVARLLETRPQLTLRGDRLTLAGDAARVELVDADAEPGPDLIGRRWAVSALIVDGAAVPAGRGALGVVRFTPDGRLEINTGCNRGIARIAVAERTVVLWNFGLARARCAGDVARLDEHMRSLLGARVLFLRFDGANLEIRGKELGLVFEAER